jgi:hypothetical protein
MGLMSSYKTFDEIRIGLKFKPPSGVTYQKVSIKKCKPVMKADGKTTISNGTETTAFYGNKIQLELV